MVDQLKATDFRRSVPANFEFWHSQSTFSDPSVRDKQLAILQAFEEHIQHLSSSDYRGDIPIIDVDEVSVTQFRKEFDHTKRPCVVLGICRDWPAVKNWSIDNLLNDKTYQDISVTCGVDRQGKSLNLPCAEFVRYMLDQQDVNPLYVFDQSLSKEGHQFSVDYRPHHFFADLFAWPQSNNPKWLLLGPARSGSCMHTDPMATSAWNALLHGRKHWVLFSPDFNGEFIRTGKGDLRTGVREVGGMMMAMQHPQDIAVWWFLNVLPVIKQRLQSEMGCEAKDGVWGTVNFKDGDWSDGNGDAHPSGMIEFIQEAGETIFVPGGWWHAVLNIENTVAVTHNFCSTGNFSEVFQSVCETDIGMGEMFLNHIKTQLTTEDPALRTELVESAENILELTRFLAGR
eukprot:c8791_g1_i1.p1 GENE.c8791_g1_i1~~c8791_g1_i1.p1  ORF type:complete len:413 (+),score=89.63 c8791_g1_i1:42-1241(+)